MLVRLVTRDGSSVLSPSLREIPPFVIAPEVLVWGDRVFVLHRPPPGATGPVTYVEGMAFHCVEGVTMHVPESIARLVAEDPAAPLPPNAIRQADGTLGIDLASELLPPEGPAARVNWLAGQGWYLLRPGRVIQGAGPFVVFVDGVEVEARPIVTGPQGQVLGTSGGPRTASVQVWVKGAAAARAAQGDDPDTCQVTVNGSPVVVRDPVSYEDLVAVAGLEGEPTITYRHGATSPAGELLPGRSLAVKAKTVFNVVHTGAA